MMQLRRHEIDCARRYACDLLAAALRYRRQGRKRNPRRREQLVEKALDLADFLAQGSRETLLRHALAGWDAPEQLIIEEAVRCAPPPGTRVPWWAEGWAALMRAALTLELPPREKATRGKRPDDPRQRSLFGEEM
jgi:hypothetical protein